MLLWRVERSCRCLRSRWIPLPQPDAPHRPALCDVTAVWPGSKILSHPCSLLQLPLPTNLYSISHPPTDHFLNVLRDPRLADSVAATYASLPPGQSIAAWKSGKDDIEEGLEPWRGQGGIKAIGVGGAVPAVQKLVAGDRSGCSAIIEKAAASGQLAAAWHTQVYILSLRMMRNLWRNPIMLMAGEYGR